MALTRTRKQGKKNKTLRGRLAAFLTGGAFACWLSLTLLGARWHWLHSEEILTTAWYSQHLSGIKAHLADIPVASSGRNEIRGLRPIAASAISTSSANGVPPFETSRRRICDGCSDARIRKEGRRCVEKVEWLMARNNRNKNSRGNERKRMRSEMDWYKEVSRRYPEDCGACDPDSCADSPLINYWRYDAAAPAISSAVTHFLPSVPSESRFPPERLGDALAYMNELWSEGNRTDVFFEFNPTVVLLPPNLAQSLEVDPQYEPVYLASFRVSSEHACLPPDVIKGTNPEQWKIMQSQNYMGLALLTSDLGIIPGTDVVIDVESELKWRTGTRGRRLVDFRLFVFNETIYLNMNGPPVFVAPISVAVSEAYFRRHFPGRSMPKAGRRRPSGGTAVSNLFGDGLEVALNHGINVMWGEEFGGKNFALFEASTGELLAETQPFGPHQVQPIKPDEFSLMSDCDVSKKLWPKKKRCIKPPDDAAYQETYRREIVNKGARVDSDRIPNATFATVDQIWFPERRVFKKFPHGGACCVRIVPPPSAKIASGGGEGSFLFVGVGHTKVPYLPWMKRASADELLDLPHHQYVSFFYAFESAPPYHVVARSGLFCLPFASETEEMTNVYAKLTHNRKLNLKRKSFECPQIHFVSGIVDKAGDESRVIVSYGINDCIPRMAEMKKTEIARLLFTHM